MPLDIRYPHRGVLHTLPETVVAVVPRKTIKEVRESFILNIVSGLME